jgi:hypothetical protein
MIFYNKHIFFSTYLILQNPLYPKPISKFQIDFQFKFLIQPQFICILNSKINSALNSLIIWKIPHPIDLLYHALTRRPIWASTQSRPTELTFTDQSTCTPRNTRTTSKSWVLRCTSRLRSIFKIRSQGLWNF